MDDKKVISIIEDLIFEDINQEDYWKAVKEAKDLIKKVKAKQLILHIVVGQSEQLVCEHEWVKPIINAENKKCCKCGVWKEKAN